jgi:hypothetical protein
VAGTPMDPDAHLRNEILRDVESMCANLGAVDAIVLSGDIAFGGLPDEYRFALQWLEELARKSGADIKSTFVCPGNHDVLRQTASRNVIQALHHQIKTSGDLVIDVALRGLLSDPESARLLYEALAAYNSFALQFFCDLFPPDRTVAQRDLRLNDGSTLRLSGLNSAFVSSLTDKPNDLFVDPAFNKIVRTPGVEHLVMCHHPYHWLRRGWVLKDHLDDVARIHLFGHEHRNRIEMGRDCVRVAAAATHPDRTEPGWEPGYNFMRIKIAGNGVARNLDFEGHLRVWQGSPGQFVPKFDRPNEPVFHQSIRLDPWVLPAAPPAPGGEDVPVGGPQPSQGVASAPAEPDPMSTLREISLGFFKLTFSQKSAIAGKLGLLEDTDVDLPDFERFRRVFIRARERGQIDDLDREVREAAAPNH